MPLADMRRPFRGSHEHRHLCRGNRKKRLARCQTEHARCVRSRKKSHRAGQAAVANLSSMPLNDGLNPPPTPLLPHPRTRRFLIDDLFGELAQVFVCLAFLFQGLLQEIRRLLFSEKIGEGPDGSVGGNLVMLDALRGADEPASMTDSSPSSSSISDPSSIRPFIALQVLPVGFSSRPLKISSSRST